jgi:hypothetical protein
VSIDVNWDVRRSDLWWLLLFPVYQVIGTARHEAGHALVAWAEGARVDGFVVLPTRVAGVLYWGFTLWDGPTDWLAAAAPYLLDALTVTVFFPLIRYARRWPHPVRMALVAVGMLSPLVNSAYQYVLYFVRPTNDVGVVGVSVPHFFIHAWFLITLPLYVWAILASLRSPAPTVSGAKATAWTAVSVTLAATVIAVVTTYAWNQPMDGCLIGTWREVSSTQQVDLTAYGSGATRLTGGGRTLTFRGGGRELIDYGPGTIYRGTATGRPELTITGMVEFRVTSAGGRMSSRVISDRTAGVYRVNGTVVAHNVFPETQAWSYTCDSQTMTETTEWFTSQAVRVTPLPAALLRTAAGRR